MKRKNSLKNKVIFNNLFKEPQKSIWNKLFVFQWFWRDDNDGAKVGLAVSKKIGNSVFRNKTKREIRLFLDEYFNFSKSVDIIIIVKLKYRSSVIEEKREMFKSLILKTPFIKK